MTTIRNLIAHLRDEAGVATAEYAMTTVAACGFAGVLYKLLQADGMQAILFEVIKKAFGLFL